MADFVLNDWSKILDPAPWSARRLMRCVSVGNYIYMTGGATDVAGTKTDEVWKCTKGTDWELLTDSPGWAARAAHGFTYYDSKFWIMGGADTAGNYLNDVWNSDDCETWEEVTSAADWSERHEFSLCEFNSEMLLTGGWNDTADPSFAKDGGYRCAFVISCFRDRFYEGLQVRN